MNATWIRRLLLVLTLVALPSCFKIGNDLTGTCKAGDECVCDLIGNCGRSCPGGGCSFVCKGTSNCTFDCAGGNCQTLCANTGNCITECSGAGCTVDCKQNAGNCILHNPQDLAVPIDFTPAPDLSARDLSSID